MGEMPINLFSFFDSPTQTLLFGWLTGVNSMGLLLMGWDKWQSRQLSARRIPENTLLAVALLGGAAGVWVSMFLFRHKTRKTYFFLSVSMLLFLHIFGLWWGSYS